MYGNGVVIGMVLIALVRKVTLRGLHLALGGCFVAAAGITSPAFAAFRIAITTVPVIVISISAFASLFSSTTKKFGDIPFSLFGN